MPQRIHFLHRLLECGGKCSEVFLKDEQPVVIKTGAGFLAAGYAQVQIPAVCLGDVKKIRPGLSGEFQGLEVFGHLFLRQGSGAQ